MKNRIISLFLVGIMVLGMISLGTTTVFAQQESKGVTIKGSIFNDTGSTVDLNVLFDFDWLTKEDNTVFNSDLAAFSAIASEDVYYREKDAGTANENKVMIKGSEDTYDCTSFLSAFGFEDVQRIETYDKYSTDIDKNDSATFLAGHRLIDGKDVFIFVFRGAYSSGEWMSMFDVGNPAMIDNHPNWTESSNIKSIDVAANSALSKINDYIKEFGKENTPDSILLTGHSRGGAIANVLGAEFEKSSTIRSYTYTFSSPRITTAEDASKYKTIFNINNSDDFYEDFLPFQNESFSRFGVDISDSFLSNSDLQSILKKFDPSGKYSCMSTQSREQYLNLFGNFFKSRDDIYHTEAKTLIFDNSTDAQEKYNAFIEVIKGFKLDDMCRAELDGEKVYLTTSKASLLKSYSMVLAYGTHDMVDYVKTLFPEDEIAELLYQNLSDITKAHLISRSYVMCLSIKPDDPSNPTDPSKPIVPTEPTNPISPQTGDTGNTALWLMLMALSSMGLVTCIIFGKKRKNVK